MRILCTFGSHAWEGCRCARCDKRRNSDHVWQGCKCTKCPTVRNSDHTWEACRCTTCDRTRDEKHAWDGCRCTVCAKARNAEHRWQGCVCAICGAKAKSGHTWSDMACQKCGQPRFADDAVTFQNMPMIKNVAIKTAAFEAYKKEQGLSDYSGPAYLAGRILGMSDAKAQALSGESSAWQLETGPASKFNSTGHWGNVPVVKVAILARYL